MYVAYCEYALTSRPPTIPSSSNGRHSSALPLTGAPISTASSTIPRPAGPLRCNSYELKPINHHSCCYNAESHKMDCTAGRNWTGLHKQQQLNLITFASLTVSQEMDEVRTHSSIAAATKRIIQGQIPPTSPSANGQHVCTYVFGDCCTPFSAVERVVSDSGKRKWTRSKSKRSKRRKIKLG